MKLKYRVLATTAMTLLVIAAIGANLLAAANAYQMYVQ